MGLCVLHGTRLLIEFPLMGHVGSASVLQCLIRLGLQWVQSGQSKIPPASTLLFPKFVSHPVSPHITISIPLWLRMLRSASDRYRTIFVLNSLIGGLRKGRSDDAKPLTTLLKWRDTFLELVLSLCMSGIMSDHNILSAFNLSAVIRSV